MDDRVSKIIFGTDDPNLLIDYRATNGSKNQTKFDDFFDAVGVYINEQIDLQVNDRRHGTSLYMPIALSMENLHKEVRARLDTKVAVPSVELLRLQFEPSNIVAKISMRYTGRFPIKYKVQRRLARVHHIDCKYVGTIYKYVKEFLVNHRNYARFCCLDDKATVPVGDPGVPIATGARGHNKALVPAERDLVAADHDFAKISGIILSVALISDIPKNTGDSFFTGTAYVTCKERIFSPSTPFRHSTELINIIRKGYSTNGVNCDRPILAIFTDGGPDHRCTFYTVKVALLQIFLQLNLDFLIAFRTAPNNSWLNPAERVMSVLNLALQHCALERDEMDKPFEDRVKYENTMQGIRNLAKMKDGFQAQYENSMKSCLNVLNKRFAQMSIKDRNIVTMPAESSENIEASLEPIKTLTGYNSNLSELSSPQLQKIKYLDDFLMKHSQSNHYMFQIKKCSSINCAYCTQAAPHRLPADEQMHWIPSPQPAAGSDKYKSFEEVI